MSQAPSCIRVRPSPPAAATRRDRIAIGQLRSPRCVKGNRLIRIEPAAATPNDGDKKTELDYDYMGRRVRKQVSESDEGQSTWVQTLDRKFVWDGWLLLLELDGTNGDAVVRKYTWGLDLTQSTRNGAGGIGGLLAVDQAFVDMPDPEPDIHPGQYLYFYDRIGNVGQVINTGFNPATDDPDAHYEYDPYGGRVNPNGGSYADTNPIRFSTKYFDDETALGYWGYRYYSPTLGRWLNRDHLGEQGGLNLFVFVGNRPISAADALGLKPQDDWTDWLQLWSTCRGRAPGFNPLAPWGSQNNPFPSRATACRVAVNRLRTRARAALAKFNQQHCSDPEGWPVKAGCCPWSLLELGYQCKSGGFFSIRAKRIFLFCHPLEPTRPTKPRTRASGSNKMAQGMEAAL